MIDFVSKAKIIHGDLYSYEKSKYVKSNQKLIVICNKHGDFYVRPSDHLCKKSGCPQCATEKKIKRNQNNQWTTEKFIFEAKKIHGDLYLYDKCEYFGSQKKICLICRIHGDFLTIPQNHIHLKNGCPICAKTNLGKSRCNTTEDFIVKAKMVHGDFYDYSKVKYLTSKDKITIICPKHGEFEQLPFNHLNFRCAKCNVDEQRKNLSLTTIQFVENAIRVHGGKYDYSKVNYISSSKHVEIICSVHGAFWQKPHHHINSACLCPLCAANDAANSRRLTTDEFIKKSKAKHGEKYDYSKAVYKNSKDKVIVVCKKHGDFLVTPSHHMHTSGCPKCAESRGETAIREFMERHIIEYKSQYYIKKTTNFKAMRFDFLTSIHEKPVFIEYNGKQHYIPSAFGKNRRNDERAKIENLIKQISKDIAKKRWIESNGYKLLTIPFWEYKNVPTILNNFFSGNPFEIVHPSVGLSVVDFQRYEKIVKRLE